MKSTLPLRSLRSVLAFGLLAASAAAAPTTVLEPAYLAGPADVSPAGDGLEAFDWSSNAQTVNGVAFTTSTVRVGALGSFLSLSGFGVSNTTAYTSTINPFNALDAPYKAMLAGSVYNSTTGTTGTVTMNGLTTGRNYLAQVWVSDPRAGTTATRTQTIAGTGTGSFPFDFNSLDAAGGLGQVANVYFTADGSPSSFTLGAAGANLPQMNAIQLRDVTGLWSGAASGDWDDSSLNFSGLSFPAAKALRDSVHFADRDASGNPVAHSIVTIASGGVTGANPVFSNNTINYTLQNAAADGLTGPHSLTLAGAGMLTLTGTHAHTAGTFLQGGTLVLSGGDDRLPADGALGFTGSATLAVGANSQTLASLTFPQQVTVSDVITGAGGSLVVNGAGNLQIGPGGSLATNFSTTLSMAELESFTYDSPASIFRVGLQGGAGNTVALGTVATATLAQTNSITADRLAVGDVAASSDGGISTLRLGAANTLNAGAVNIGFSGRSDATLEFAAAGSAASLRGKDGGETPVPSFNVGSIANFASAAQKVFTSAADFSNGTLDARVTAMNVGVANATSTGRGGTTNASVTMGAGQLAVDALNLGRIEGGSANSIGAAFAGNGTFTLNSPAGTVSAGTITLATNTITASGAFDKITNGIFNLNDGTLVAATIQRGAQTGTATTVNASLNWNNGTIRHPAAGDLVIAAGVQVRVASTGTHTLWAEAGRTSRVNAAISDLSGGGTLAKDGPGTAVLAGANTYSGSTIVNDGTLLVTGSLGTTAVSLPAGAFSMENQATGTLSVASLAQTGGDLVLDVGTGGADVLTVTGPYAHSGGAIRLVVNGTPPAGPVAILQYGVLGGTPPVLTESRIVATPDYGSGTADAITVTFSGTPATLTWTGINGGDWNINSTVNWDNAGSGDVFKQVDDVVFGDGAANLAPVLSGTIAPGSVTFTNNLDSYTLAGAGIAGSGGFTQAGTATTVLINNNTFTGTTTVTDGTLQIGNGGTTGALAASSPITVAAPGTLGFFRADNPYVIANPISGDGTLAFLGTGVTQQSSYTLSGNNSGFSGIATATNARVNIDNYSNDLGTALVRIGNGAGLYLQSAGAFPNHIEITGQGWLENAGLLGAIRIQSGANATGTITLTGAARITAHGSTGTLSGTLAESGGSHELEFANLNTGANSTLTLAESLANTRSGPTRITNATLVALSSASFGPGQVTVGGPVRAGRIQLGNGRDFPNSLVVEANIGTVGRGVVEATGTDVATWSGPITVQAPATNGGTFFTEAGASLLIAGPITGNFTQRDGNITYSGGGSYSSMSITGLAKAGAENGLATNAVVDIGVSGAGTLDLNGFAQTLEGISKGANAATVTNNGASDSTLTLVSASDRTFSGVLADGTTNKLAMVKAGTGMFTLAGTNTHTGPTHVTAGTLRVTGQLGTTPVTVNDATLGGTGTIIGPVQIGSGGTLAPGASAGTLTTGATIFDPGSYFDWEIADWAGAAAGTDWDLLAAASLTFANTPASQLTIRITGPAANFTESNRTFVIATAAGGITGFDQAAIAIDASAFTGTGTWAVGQNGNAVELVYTAGSGSPYSLWAQTNISNLAPAAPAGFDEDADGDGIANGLEWILGGGPLAQDAASLFNASASAGGGLVLSFTRAADSVGVAGLAVDWDTGLAGGFANSIPILTPIAPSGNNPWVAIDTNADPDEVIVTIPAANALPAGRIFAILRAWLP
jgi:autotransporter-associated beta strand protein